MSPQMHAMTNAMGNGRSLQGLNVVCDVIASDMPVIVYALYRLAQCIDKQVILRKRVHFSQDESFRIRAVLKFGDRFS